MSKLNLPLVEVATTPESTRATLTGLEKKYGFLPNLYRVFANAPIALDAYLAVSEAFQHGTLTPTERNIVLLTASRENGCHYCVAVHSTVADMQRDPTQVTDAIRDGRPLSDPKLEALRRFTQSVVGERGHVAEGQVDAFLSAGYQSHHVLEVLVGVTLKTLSNYTNHFASTPLDGPFSARAFKPTER